MTSRPEYIKCIAFDKKKSWCGRNLYRSEWHFLTIEHAAMNRSASVACPECTAEILKHLSEGHEAEKEGITETTVCSGFEYPKSEENLTIQICTLGMHGQAYDLPGTKRAYTYRQQPNNVAAYKLGNAVVTAAKNPGGDLIDQGLALLHALEEEGFGVFDLKEKV